jgi:hypothetical protein
MSISDENSSKFSEGDEGAVSKSHLLFSEAFILASIGTRFPTSN